MSDMTMPARPLAIDPTAQRALAINLDESIYGSFS